MEVAVVGRHRAKKAKKAKKKGPPPKLGTRKSSNARVESTNNINKRRTIQESSASPNADSDSVLPVDLFPQRQEEGGGWNWRKVKVDQPLIWGCTEGGFLELEEIDGSECSEHQPDIGTAAGKIIRMQDQPAATTIRAIENSKQQTQKSTPAVKDGQKRLGDSDDASDLKTANLQTKPQTKARPGPNKRTRQKKRRRERLRAEAAVLNPSDSSAVTAANTSTCANHSEKQATGDGVDVSTWRALPVQLDERVLTSISQLGFSAPTPIQAQTLPIAIGSHSRDLIGGAETGSGKTLAFGIPIVQRLLHEADSIREGGRTKQMSISALVLTPTRELALQVHKHLKALLEGCSNSLQVVPIVGGMAEQKQRRLLKKRPEIVVATPGRYWGLLSTGEGWLSPAKLSFFVLDEADRMIEAGHFEELDEIISAVPKKAKDRQVLLFTATLHADGEDGAGRPRRTLQQLTRRVPFRGKPAIIDLTAQQEDEDGSEGEKNVDATGKGAETENEKRIAAAAKAAAVGQRLPSGLMEYVITCPNEKKTEYLYYFLCRSPGRTLVFVNAISSIRRLTSLLELCELPVFGLHSKMQQRQRIKTVERFQKLTQVIVVATDVAARGIDVKGVDHVVHYQITKSTDTYIHRCGRTARAGAKGVSLALVAETEHYLWSRTRRELGTRVKDPPQYPIERGYMAPLRARLSLVEQIDKLRASQRKAKAESNWLKKAAAEIDAVLEDNEGEHSDEDASGSAKQAARKMSQLQRDLQGLLCQPLLPTGFSSRHLAADPTLARKILDLRAEAEQSGKKRGPALNVMTGAGSLGDKSVHQDSSGSTGGSVADGAMISTARTKTSGRRARKRKLAEARAAAETKRQAAGSAGCGRVVGGVFFPGSSLS